MGRKCFELNQIFLILEKLAKDNCELQPVVSRYAGGMAGPVQVNCQPTTES